MPNNKIVAFDKLRIVAAFAVVVLHTVAPLFMDLYPSSDWSVANMYESLVRWCVSIFFMISGALFLKKEKDVNIGRLFKKNILRILLAYLFWSAIYVIPLLNNGLNLSYILYKILIGPFHFWFLKTLIGLYIAIPLFRTITSNRKTEEYFLLLAMMFGIVLPSALSVIELYDISLVAALRGFYKSFNITFVSISSFYFVLGHYLLEYPISVAKRRIIYIIGILSQVLVFGATYYGSMLADSPYQGFLGDSFVCNMFLAVAIFTFFVNSSNSITSPNKVLTKVSECTFGVYILHMYIIDLLYKAGFTPSAYSPYWFIPMYALMVFAISFSITFVLRWIPFVKRWLM